MNIQKLKFYFLVGSLSLLVNSAYADISEKLPLPLVEAATAYKEKGSEDFLPALVKGSRLQHTDNTSLHQANTTFRAIEMMYGEYLGIEFVSSVTVSSSTRIVYFILKYERGPLYGVVDVYKINDDEIVTNSNVNTDLLKIIPVDVITNIRDVSLNNRD